VSGRRLLKLGKRVLVWRVAPYPVRGREECFVVDWPSFWDEDLSVEVGVVAVRKRSGRWKVVELELPSGVPEEDAEDIVLCRWYVFDRNDRRRKCPPIYMAWDFDDPPVWVAACERPTHEKQLPFAERLKELEAEPDGPDEAGPEAVWESGSLVDELRRLGPGICTVTTDCGALEFDILESGRFAERSFCPGCAGAPGREADGEVLRRLALLLARSVGAGVAVRTFTRETVCVRNERDELVRVPVKEIRGFVVRVAGRRDGRPVLEWEKLAPDAVREAYSRDARTGEFIGLTVGERDHRFA
jgi:hypothetical protein